MQTPDTTGAAASIIAETLAKLGADDKTDLTDAEVQARLKQYGPNALVPQALRNSVQCWASSFCQS